jgi:hypothetical protein
VLAKISIQLILKHPFLFLKSAAGGWWMFWRTSVYWSPDALRLPWLSGVIQSLIQIERVLLFFTNLVFIFASLYFVIHESLSARQHQPGRARIQFSNPAQRGYMWMILGILWVASILQTLLDHGDNPRFLVPLQSLVVLWVAAFLFLLVQGKTPQLKSVKQVE